MDKVYGVRVCGGKFLYVQSGRAGSMKGIAYQLPEYGGNEKFFSAYILPANFCP